MRPNPYLHALVASAYIWGIGLLIRHIASLHHDTPDNLAGSITALSLVVLSASVMAFLFFYYPVALLIEGKKDKAVFFFLKTLGAFAFITVLMVVTIL